MSSSSDWSTGDYGESLSTEIWYVPLNVRYDWRRWLFRVTLPYIRVTGPGNVVVGGAGVIVACTQARRETRDGVGDMIAGVTHRLDPLLPVLPYFDFTVKAKSPTARTRWRDRRGCGFVHFCALSSSGSAPSSVGAS